MSTNCNCALGNSDALPHGRASALLSNIELSQGRCASCEFLFSPTLRDTAYVVRNIVNMNRSTETRRVLQ